MSADSLALMPASAFAPLHRRAREAWSLADPVAKCAAVDALARDFPVSSAPDDGSPDARMNVQLEHCMRAIDLDCLEPGRPARPVLVLPQKVAARATGSREGRAALLHAIAHIEFNAINLALDALWRYPDMPAPFAMDWLSVASDEARHFRMLIDEMALGDVQYGDFDAHDGLWAMARRTAGDLVARMALVPRVLEARGLDATPAIQQRLRQAGEPRAVAILQTILDEEIGHVAIGNRWFQRLCVARALDPESHFRELMIAFDAPRPRGRVNREARLAAGFSEAELAWLDG